MGLAVIYTRQSSTKVKKLYLKTKGVCARTSLSGRISVMSEFMLLSCGLSNRQLACFLLNWQFSPQAQDTATKLKLQHNLAITINIW